MLQINDRDRSRRGFLASVACASGAALLPVAYGAHQGTLSQVASAALQAIDGGDIEKAIAVLKAAANPENTKQG